ncbi:unnamed protein product [Effrenium voratum]|nr:unnamed protein product [Effrenium voratum]
MSGKDVFAVMPTGAGKSLCYQLPAMVLQGTTVVVSPLLSLMEDQVCSLQERHVQAARLGSDATPERSNSRVLQDLAQDALKLLYVSPERVVEDKGPKSKGSSLGRVLRELHHRKKLSLLVVDEAHCISQWGMDFRKVYRKLACLRQTYPGVRILATTASATKKVEEDVLKSLNLRDAISFHDDTFDRPNLFMEVRTKISEEKSLQELVDLVLAASRPACVVYVTTRQESGACVPGALRPWPTLLPVPCGHERRRAAPILSEMEGWRKLCHGGDCGLRDGDRQARRSICLSPGHAKLHGKVPPRNWPCRSRRLAVSMHLMVLAQAGGAPEEHGPKKLRPENQCDAASSFFAEKFACRRQALLRHFGQTAGQCGACDVCCMRLSSETRPVPRDVTKEAVKALDLAKVLMPHGVTSAKLRDALRGKRVEGHNLTAPAAEKGGALKEPRASGAADPAHAQEECAAGVPAQQGQGQRADEVQDPAASGGSKGRRSLHGKAAVFYGPWRRSQRGPADAAPRSEAVRGEQRSPAVKRLKARPFPSSFTLEEKASPAESLEAQPSSAQPSASEGKAKTQATLKPSESAATFQARQTEVGRGSKRRRSSKAKPPLPREDGHRMKDGRQSVLRVAATSWCGSGATPRARAQRRGLADCGEKNLSRTTACASGTGTSSGSGG